MTSSFLSRMRITSFTISSASCFFCSSELPWGKFHNNVGHVSLLGYLFGALLEHFFHDRQCGEYVWPACIKRQLCKHFRSLFLRQAIVHCSIKVIADLRHLSGCDESADRYQAAVSRRQSRTQPEITEEDIRRVLDNARRDDPEVLFDTSCASLLRVFV